MGIIMEGFFRIHQGLWFCYVFFASLTLNLPAQKCSAHRAPNMCVHAIKGNFIAICYLIFLLWQFFLLISKKCFHDIKLSNTYSSQCDLHAWCDFLRSLFSAIVISQHINPCDIFRSYVTFDFQVIQQATIEVEISAEIYNNLRKYIL